MDDSDRTIYCGGLCDEVTDAVLFELFNQAGPVESVRRPRDPSTGYPKPFGFIVYKHECSVPYAVELFRCTKLFNKQLIINTRSRARHVPVLNTHSIDFDTLLKESTRAQKRSRDDAGYQNQREYDSRSYHDRGKRRDEDFKSRKDLDSEPSSWSALKGQGLKANGLYRDDLQSSSRSRSSDVRPNVYGAQNPPDFSALLQFGQQMMFPGMFPPMALPPNLMPMMSMGLGPGIGMSPNMFPSMQGGYGGGRVSPDRHGHRRDHHDDRHDRRDRPYDRRHERRDDYHQHDRRYSSSRSSHDRESRDRRSR